MNTKRTICHGDIYTCNFGINGGSIQNGSRPVIVLQDDKYSKNSPTVIVAPITSVIKKGYLPSHVYLGRHFGLKRASMILIEQVRTVNKSELQKYIGTVTNEIILNQLWRSVKKTMGFWDSERNRPLNVMTICPTCLKKEFDSGKYAIHRVNHYSCDKEFCDICKIRLGYNYSLTRKREAVNV
ncbi:MAG: type II toxin-antitoxin system PemK/MazF family toxin [Clostridia bacterium]|nr:type II toxin-antitoxin system PemK/MazF family toxin [Clostridia bacterium]